MKTTLIPVCLSLLLSSLPGSARAPMPARPTHSVNVRVFVHDPDGQPIEGAEVALGLTYYRLEKIEGKTVRAMTNKEGFASLSGVAESEYRVSAEKPSYYRTVAPARYLDSESGVRKYATGIQEMKIELRPIKNPIAGIRRSISALRLPRLNAHFGFDAEVGDWVAPNGKGRVTDFLLGVDGYYQAPQKNSLKLSLRFPRAGDGLQAIKVEGRPWTGSEFKYPYEAPLDGYATERTWEKSSEGKKVVFTIDPSGATNYLFRIRTERDPGGQLKNALYGVITREFDFGKKGGTDYGVSFSYWLNPEWTRSLEADPKQTVTAVKP